MHISVDRGQIGSPKIILLTNIHPIIKDVSSGDNFDPADRPDKMG